MSFGGKRNKKWYAESIPEAGTFFSIYLSWIFTFLSW